MHPLRPPASLPRSAILAALAAVALHAAAGFLALRAPGEKVEQPPVPLEVRFVVEAPPAAAPAPAPKPPPPRSQAGPKPEPKPQPARPPERRPEPRPVVRRTPPAQKTPPAPPPETLVADSVRAAPEAPVAPAPRPPPPGPAVETAPAAPAPAAATSTPSPAPAASAASSASAASAASASGPATSAPRFDAAYLANPPPAYPMISRRLGEEGRVLLRVHVEADGRPSSVELRDSSGSGRLDDAALRAVRGWRFVPARRGEQAVAAWVLVPINFTLKNS